MDDPRDGRRFCSRPFHAIVGTISRSGAPQLSPVWYLYEDGRLYFGIIAGTAKHKNIFGIPASRLHRRGRDDVRTVIFHGRARLVAERGRTCDGESSADTTRARPRPRTYYDTIRDVPALLVVLEPERVITQDFND